MNKETYIQIKVTGFIITCNIILNGERIYNRSY